MFSQEKLSWNMSSDFLAQIQSHKIETIQGGEEKGKF